MERDSMLYKVRRKGQIMAHKIMPDETMAKLYSRVILKKKVDLKILRLSMKRFSGLKFTIFLIIRW